MGLNNSAPGDPLAVLEALVPAGSEIQLGESQDEHAVLSDTEVRNECW